jgi:hypothetical protein
MFDKTNLRHLVLVEALLQSNIAFMDAFMKLKYCFMAFDSALSSYSAQQNARKAKLGFTLFPLYY